MSFDRLLLKAQVTRLIYSAIILAFSMVLFAPKSDAVTLLKKKKTPFLQDITTFTTTLSLPVKEMTETIRIPQKKIRARLVRSEKDKTVEPLSVILGPSESHLMAIAEKISAVDREEELIAFLRKARTTAKPTKTGSDMKIIYLNREAFPLIDPEALADMYSKTHHNLEINTAELRKNKKLKKEFIAQIKNFFPKKERKKLIAKIEAGQPITVNTELLPNFARKMVGKYIIFRGPNCFHAALAFQSPKMTNSSLINVKEEKNYHRAMINYDELWRAINHNFYEINADEQSLKYGDMVVFFDVPEDDNMVFPINYKTIRHTTTYLFGGYTFSKGSKSPNTPYTVRTLAEEWKTWKRFTKNLGVKIYRRSKAKVSRYPPRDQIDWMY
jgi:hypothetical protein